VPNSMVPLNSIVPGSVAGRDPGSPEEPFNVVIAGGGVAGLEAALALRELGGKSIVTTLVASDPELVYRPLTVREPFGYPLADTRRLQMGQLPAGTYNEDVGPQDTIAVTGAFKTPGLRNVELTAPYFHNGGAATLEQVVAFYNRGGDFAQQSPDTVRSFMRPLGLSTDEQTALVAFLKSLTDERVRFEKAPFDHPQIFVPNGHPGDQGQVTSDGTGKAADALMEIPAVGAGGGPALSPVF